MTPETTFIYALSDPQSGEIRYIGKANDPQRRWRKHITRSATQDHRGCWIRSLISQGLKPELRILEGVPQAEWQKFERDYIRMARLIGMDLVNSVEGGIGGLSPTLETRAKLSRYAKNRPAEHQAKIGAANRGRPHLPKPLAKNPAETYAKISAALRGRIFSPEWRAKISAAKSNPSTETRARMSAAQRGRKFSIETRAKMSESGKRKIFTPEHLANMRAGRNRKKENILK